MAVLVCHDVGLGEVATTRPEALLERIEEAEVEIDAGVVRAVEGTDRRRRRARSAVEVWSVKRTVSNGCVALAGRREGVRPVGLDAVDVADDPAIGALVGIGARLALLPGGSSNPGRTRRQRRREDELRWVATEQEIGDDEDEANATTSDRDAAATDATAAVLELVRVEPCVRVERHVGTSVRSGPVSSATRTCHRRHQPCRCITRSWQTSSQLIVHDDPEPDAERHAAGRSNVRQPKVHGREEAGPVAAIEVVTLGRGARRARGPRVGPLGEATRSNGMWQVPRPTSPSDCHGWVMRALSSDASVTTASALPCGGACAARAWMSRC